MVPKLVTIYVANLLHLKNMNKELAGELPAFVNLGRPSMYRVYYIPGIMYVRMCIQVDK